MRNLITATKDALAFVRLHGLWRSLHMKEAPWLIQFGKYGLCGVAAVVAHNTIVALVNGLWLPFTETSAPELTRAERATRLCIANLVAFPVGNVVAYSTNALWVFTGGRHHRVREFLYFTAISFIAFLPALACTILVVYGLKVVLAQICLIITSAMVNFLCRKFFVFKG